MNSAVRPLAVVTGASSGIGLELAKEAWQGISGSGFLRCQARDRH